MHESLNIDNIRVSKKEVEVTTQKSNEEKNLSFFKKTKDLYTSVPVFVLNKKPVDIVEIENETTYGDGSYIIWGKDKEGNWFRFYAPKISNNSIKKGISNKDNAVLEYAKDKEGNSVPVDEKDRVCAIKESIKNNIFYKSILQKEIKAEDAIEVIKSAGLSIPVNIKEIVENNFYENENEKIGDIAPETTFYDINPKLKLLEENADVSYVYNREHFQRNMDIYMDERGNRWFQIETAPRKQMMISLLSQPFFNISIVAEATVEKNNIKKFFEKINPKLLSILAPITKIFNKSTTRFFSKGLNLIQLPEIEKEKILAEYIVFGAVFDHNTLDRDFKEGHNINRNKETYALFDFGSSSITPLKYFNSEKASENIEDFMKQIKYLLYPQDVYNLSEKALPFTIIDTINKKLNDMHYFFNGADGQKFFEAVFLKSGFAKEFKEKMENDKYTDFSEVESYCDSNEMYKGLLAQIEASFNGLLNELETHKEKYIEDDVEKYNKLIYSLTEKKIRTI